MRSEEPLSGVLQGVAAHLRLWRHHDGREHREHVHDERELDEVGLAVEAPPLLRAVPTLAQDLAVAVRADEVVIVEDSDKPARADALTEEPLS